jgi:hypothetical protein
MFLVLEIKTERIKPKIDGSTFDSSSEFRFNVPASSDYFTRFFALHFTFKNVCLKIIFIFSFPTDFQVVMDAVVLVTYCPENAAQNLTKETLYPPRHKITLPLNSLNNYFQNCEIAFNHHTKLDCDRNYFLDFDGWGLMSSLDQNFNPSISDIERRSQLGKYL